MKRSYFPDVNVWLALCAPNHVHGDIAKQWYRSITYGTLALCRVTQLGVLRLLTLQVVMQEYVHTNDEALNLLDVWVEEGSTKWVEEPPFVEKRFRTLSYSHLPSPKLWNDAYLSAFATEAGLTLVTFDQALAKRTPNAILL